MFCCPTIWCDRDAREFHILIQGTKSVSPKALKVSDTFPIVTMFAALQIEPLLEMAMVARASSHFKDWGTW